MIVALVLGIFAGGMLIAVVSSVIIWRGLHAGCSAATAAAEPVLTPHSATVEVGCRRPNPLGRPIVPRTDLLVGHGRTPRLQLEWTPCGTSPVTSQSWNARQWYSPDAVISLQVPPVPSKSWDWKQCTSLSDTSVSSRSQNWYRPAYHNGSTSSNSHHPQYFYVTRVKDPRVKRTTQSFWTRTTPAFYSEKKPQPIPAKAVEQA